MAQPDQNVQYDEPHEASPRVLAADSKAWITRYITSRQSDLLNWMRERGEHNGLTAAEIVVRIGRPYDTRGYYREAPCRYDLEGLAEKGLVDRSSGRPARWTVR